MTVWSEALPGIHCRAVGAFTLVVVVGSVTTWRVSYGTEDIATGTDRVSEYGRVDAAKRACEDAAIEAGIAVPR